MEGGRDSEWWVSVFQPGGGVEPLRTTGGEGVGGGGRWWWGMVVVVVVAGLAVTLSLLRGDQPGVVALTQLPPPMPQVLFDAGAATPETIVYAWSSYSPADIIATGRRAVDSSDAHW